MHVYTVGYGGRKPADFLTLLQSAGVVTVADVRLRPDRASLGCYTLTRKPDTGIVALLGSVGIGYISLPELGNLYLDRDDSLTRYARFFERSADLLVDRLLSVPGPIALLCAEKKVAECHRRTIADYLATLGHPITHLDGGEV